MSVNEIQALGQTFADAFDQRDIKTVIDMLSDDVEVIDTVPYRFDGEPLFAKFLTEAFEGIASVDRGVYPIVARKALRDLSQGCL